MKRQEILKRAEKIVGTNGLLKLKNSHIVICGVGGVGSFAAESLARSGVGKITLIDFDTVQLSNINRQLPALMSTIGQYKTEVLRERFVDFGLGTDMIEKRVFIDSDHINELIPRDADYVLDCIDSVKSKLALITYCLQNRIPILSAMGAGNKMDPSKLAIAKIEKTHTCPLAKIVRLHLKKENLKGLEVAFSTEIPIKTPDHVIGSMIFVPSSMGILMASHVTKRLIEEP